MGPELVGVLSPCFDLLPGVLDGQGPVHIEAFVPEAPVLYESVIDGLSRSRETELYIVIIHPFVRDFRDKFATPVGLGVLGDALYIFTFSFNQSVIPFQYAQEVAYRHSRCPSSYNGKRN
jgi:hypothetical protein